MTRLSTAGRRSKRSKKEVDQREFNNPLQNNSGTEGN